MLDAKLQDEKKLNKWSPRARRGQYMGKSPLHDSSVGLIRNLGTGYISPQFHVVYDNKFKTVIGGYDDNDSLLSHIWDSLVQDNSENVIQQATLEQKPLPQFHTD